MTDTRSRGKREQDEATLDLFADEATGAAGKTEMTKKSEGGRRKAEGKKAAKGKAGQVAEGKVNEGRGGGGKGGGGGSSVASGDDFIDMALFAERSYLT